MSPKPKYPTTSDGISTLWRWYCALAALEAGAALAFLVAVPREGPGFSAARVGVLAFLLVALLVFAFGTFRSIFPARHLTAAFIPIPASLGASAAVALYLLRYLDPPSLQPYYDRLSIPLLYVLALCLQAILLLGIPHFRGITDSARPLLLNLPRAAFVWLVLLLVLALVSLTRLGLTPDPAYWGEPGVPILGWQLTAALLLGALVLCLSLRFAHVRKLDVALCTGIWLLAVGAWLLVPIGALQNSFYAPIGPPAQIPFPNSDAGYYDSMAHSLLIGYPYQGVVPTRPLLVVLLAGLHAVFGERYDLIIVGQTLILALIPVLLFRLGTLIHSRPAGVIAAVAAIGREWTSLMVSSATRVSNSKMLLADLPTLLAVLACCLFVLRWLRQRDARSAALAGGAYGLLLLLRTQTLVLLPILLLFGVLVLGFRRTAFLQAGAFLLCMAIALSPWLLHNYVNTGQIALDAPFQYRIIASQYRYTGNLDIQNVDLQGKSILGILATFALKDPAFVFGFVANHAMATQVGGVLALPLIHASPGLLSGVEPYWVNWNGRLGADNLILVILYLGILGLGLASAWTRLRWTGLLPLGFSLGYSLANGIARFSGWRYDLPADWIAYFYFAVGAAEVLLLTAALFGVLVEPLPADKNGPDRLQARLQIRVVAPVLGAFLLIGGLPWLAALMTSPRFAWATPAAVQSRLSSSPAVRVAGVTSAELESAVRAPGAALEVGRILYPRFFTRGTGLASAHPWPAYAPRDFPRLGFLLLNQTRQDVLLPSRSIPAGLDHAADAIVLGCRRADYIEARLVLVPETDVLVEVAPLSDPCD